MTKFTRTTAALLSAVAAPAAFAADTIDKADVAWMLVATTLVLFMTIPGIALFYGGMSRKKNLLSVLAQSSAICCALSVMWVVVGYSLAFTPGNPWIGSFDHIFLKGLSLHTMSGSIPTLLFMIPRFHEK